MNLDDKTNPEYRSTNETIPQGKSGIGESKIVTSPCAQNITPAIERVIK